MLIAAFAAPSFARMGVPKVACEASPSAIVVTSQEFVGENQFPNVLTFNDSGVLIFTHGSSKIQSDFTHVVEVRYGPVPTVLNLFALSVVDREKRIPADRPTAYITADCLSQLIRRFEDRVSFKDHL
nr:hypothetical protein [uncultured Dongia sp.]